MRTAHAVAAFAVAMLISPAAWSDAVKVKETRRINAPVAKVWTLIGGFNDLDKWHPVVAKSELDAAGKVRTLTTQDGAKLVEELVGSTDRSYSYRILNSPLPVADYTSTLQAASVDANTTEVSWASEFQAKGASEAEAGKVISGIYTAGFDNLEKLVK